MRFDGRRENGDTLVEVILAIALMSLVLVSAFNIVGSSYRTAMLSKERLEAVSLAQQQAERLRKLRDDALLAGTNFSAIPFPPTGQVLVDGLYTVSLEARANVNPQLDPILKTYAIKVEWVQAGTTDTIETEIIVKLADRSTNNIERDCSVVESC